MTVKKPESFGALLFPTTLLLATGFKLLVASRYTDTLLFSSVPMALSLVGLVLLIAFSTLVPGKFRAFAYFLLSAVITLLLLSDVWYFRHFSDLPSFVQMKQMGQLGKVGGSFFHSVRLWDIIFCLDLPLYFWIARREPADLSWRQRGVMILLAASLASVVYFKLDSFLTPSQRSVREAQFQNYAIGREFGLVYYHWFDLTRRFLPTNRETRPSRDIQFYVERCRSSQRSMAADTPYKGKGEKLNVLLIILESWQSFAVDLKVADQPVMPFLSEYKRKGLYFERVYDQTNHSSSADGEFILANSLHPSASGSTPFVYAGNSFKGMPSYLSDAGYWTAYFGYYNGGFWNARVMVPAYGYEHAFFAPFGDPPLPVEMIGWGLSDLAILSRVREILERRNEPAPFFAVAECSMGHHPFKELDEQQSLLSLPAPINDTVLGDYLQLCRFRDANLAKFLTEFEKSPLAEDTIVILTGDHSAPFTQDEMKLLRDNPATPLWALAAEEHSVPLLIKHPALGERIFSEPIGQLDIAPTVLHLLGVIPEKPVFLGHNAFTETRSIFCRKKSLAVATPYVIDVLKRLSFNYNADRESDFSQHQNIAEAAILEWRISDEILDGDLIPRIQDEW